MFNNNYFYNDDYNNELNKSKLFKIGLISFYILAIFLIIIVFYSIIFRHDLKTKKRVYNMNLTEKVDLNNINHINNTKWFTDSKNINIKNNIVSAKNTGKAYVYAKKNNRIVSDLTINVTKNKKNNNSNNNGNNFFKFIQNFIYKLFPSLKPDKSLKNDDINIIEKKSKDDKEDIKINDNDALNSETYTDDVISDINDSKDDIIYDDEEKIDDIIIQRDNYKLKKGQSIKINYNLISDNYKSSDLEWSSDNNNVCIVSNDGIITGINKGQTMVHVSFGDVSKKISIVVSENVILPKDIEISSDEVEIEVGTSKIIDATVIPKVSTHSKLYWVSSDNSVVTVDGGRIFGKKTGEAIVAVVTKNNIKKYIKVKVVKNDSLSNAMDIKEINWYMLVGSSRKIKTDIIPEDVNHEQIKINYDTKYLFVDDNNNINALKSGNTKLYIYINKKIIVLNIFISDIKVSLNKIVANEKNIDLQVNETKVVKVTYEPINTTDNEISWLSSNSKIVTVDNNGLIRGISEGKALLYVVSNNNSKIFDTLLVNVKKQDNNDSSVPSIIINNNDANLNVGESKRLIAAVNNNNSYNIIKWKSSNEKIVTVDDTGNIKGVSTGTAIISAYLIDKDGNIVAANTKNASCKVNVFLKETEIKINYSSTTLDVGKKLNLVATIYPSNTTNKNVTWISSNNNIATVDSNGIVTAKSAGNVTITASTVNKKTAFVIINVKSIPIVKPNNTPTPKVLKNGFIKSNNYTYYYVNDKMVTGIKKIGNYNYYFDNNGHMVTGLKKIGSYYYYFESNGTMISGWKNVNGIKMYFKTNGKRASGKVQIDNGKYKDTYWFDEKTGKIEGHVLGITYIHQMYGVWDPNKKNYSKKDYNPNTKNFLNNKPIGGAACGITSSSMAITSLRGKLTSPTEFNSSKYGFNGKGSNYNVAVLTAKKYNLKGKVYNVLSKKEIKEHIDKGHFIVVGVKGSIYGGGGDTKGGNSRTTGGGHFVLIHGYKGDLFAVADPNNVSQTYVRSGKLNTYESFASHQGGHPGGSDFRQYGIIYK